jgi:hypothetical protein
MTAIAIGFGGLIALFLLVVATGGTFQQRCESYFPKASALQNAQCVELLSDGAKVADLPKLMREVQP